MSISLKEATCLIHQGTLLQLQNQSLVKSSFSTHLKNFFIPHRKTAHIERLLSFAKELFNSCSNERKADVVDFCDALIKKYQNVKQLSSKFIQFDRVLGLFRKNVNAEASYITPVNLNLLAKWKRYNYDEAIFHKHPEFVDFLFQSTLISQMKITKDTIKVCEGKPALLVEGQWMPYDKLQETFSFKFYPEYNETLLYKKETNQIYSYLDLGTGLIEFNPFTTGLNRPISKITKKEYLETLEVAQRFIREGEDSLDVRHKKRRFIFQIVTSTVKTNTQHPLTGNFNKFFAKPKHSYIRLINPEGEVFETGYILGKKLKEPLSTDKGKFRSVDPWEFTQCDERIVTNIAIDKKEFKKAQAYVNNYMTSPEKPAFNYIHQNCTVFTRLILKSSTGILIPTEMSIFKVALAITPEFMRRIGLFFKRLGSAIARPIIKFTPLILKNTISLITNLVKLVVKATTAFFLSLVNLVLGGLGGTKGRKFTDHKVKKNLQPSLIQPQSWFNINTYKINITAPLQQWQQKQPSTVIYKNPLKLAISKKNKIFIKN
ncbi:MAG: hypothetical protein BGO14_05550 [Chlamydiales bacterium 38-26]|nr:hypothetical protein [Chlamydiales bacterium]OJV08364.1 MAG: hypothetical protein BGO14_05550 [Chlamydiales bacterium 38-26]